MSTQVLTSQKYLAESLKAEALAEKTARNQIAKTAVFQFGVACCLIGLVVSWETWLPVAMNQVDFLVEFMVAIYHG